MNINDSPQLSAYNESLKDVGFMIKTFEDNNQKKNVIFVLDENVFIQNPIRILQCIELAIKYNLSIDDQTQKLMHENRFLIEKIQPEIVFEKLKQIMLSDDIKYYLENFYDLFFVIIPELGKSYNFNQYNDYHIYDVYNHTISVVSHTSPNLYLRLAALFHDIGKPDSFTQDDKGIGHFYGHALKSVEIFNEFAKKYNLDEKTRKIVSDLILFHQDELSKKNSNIYKFYKKFDMNNIGLLFMLKRADIMGQNPKYKKNRLERLELLEKKFLFIRDRIRGISYSGKNLVKIGVDKKIIKLVLDDIKYKIITGQLKDDSDEIDKYVSSKVLYKTNE